VVGGGVMLCEIFYFLNLRFKVPVRGIGSVVALMAIFMRW